MRANAGRVPRVHGAACAELLPDDRIELIIAPAEILAGFETAGVRVIWV
jgi:hypothetical protein